MSENIVFLSEDSELFICPKCKSAVLNTEAGTDENWICCNVFCRWRPDLDQVFEFEVSQIIAKMGYKNEMPQMS